MTQGAFKYEDDLLKHHVRVNGWLPRCRNRHREINRGAKPNQKRRLRYFTFCAVGAVDVLMLDVARLIRSSDRQDFGTVVFFDRDRELVDETQKRIPGAVGYPGNFADLVLTQDNQEDALLPGYNALAPLEQAADERVTREKQTLLAQRRDFILDFPFDVINLDLEEFAFKQREMLPGNVVRALRKILQWQRNELVIKKKNRGCMDGFTLMFTTQIGPPNIGDEYVAMLEGAIKRNVDAEPILAAKLKERFGSDQAKVVKEKNFDLFFQLGLQKIILATLDEEDWYVDDQRGLSLFEFERSWVNGTYKILHLAMDVKRKHPPKDNRAPGEDSKVSQAAYKAIAEHVFSSNATLVEDAMLDKPALQDSLDKIKSRRRKFYPDSNDVEQKAK